MSTRYALSNVIAIFVLMLLASSMPYFIPLGDWSYISNIAFIGFCAGFALNYFSGLNYLPSFIIFSPFIVFHLEPGHSIHLCVLTGNLFACIALTHLFRRRVKHGPDGAEKPSPITKTENNLLDIPLGLIKLLGGLSVALLGIEMTILGVYGSSNVNYENAFAIVMVGVVGVAFTFFGYSCFREAFQMFQCKDRTKGYP